MSINSVRRAWVGATVRIVTSAMLSVLVLALPRPLVAQRLEVAASVGYATPGATQFSVVIPRAGQPGENTFEGRHEGGIELGGSATFWASSLLGIRVGGGVWQTRWKLTSDQPSSSSDAARLSRAFVQLAARTRLGPTRVSAAVGPALVHFGGEAYEPGSSWLADESVVGVAAGLHLSLGLGGAFALVVSAENVMYRVKLGQVVPPPNQPPTTTPLQHDRRLSAGIALRR